MTPGCEILRVLLWYRLLQNSLRVYFAKREMLDGKWNSARNPSKSNHLYYVISLIQQRAIFNTFSSAKCMWGESFFLLLLLQKLLLLQGIQDISSLWNSNTSNTLYPCIIPLRDMKNVPFLLFSQVKKFHCWRWFTHSWVNILHSPHREILWGKFTQQWTILPDFSTLIFYTLGD